MSRLRPSFVLGYHGCHAAIADELLKGKTSLKHLHSTMDNAPQGSGIEPFDTVRGMVVEGEPIYEGCGYPYSNRGQE